MSLSLSLSGVIVFVVLFVAIAVAFVVILVLMLLPKTPRYSCACREVVNRTTFLEHMTRVTQGSSEQRTHDDIQN